MGLYWGLVKLIKSLPMWFWPKPALRSTASVFQPLWFCSIFSPKPISVFLDFSLNIFLSSNTSPGFTSLMRSSFIHPDRCNSFVYTAVTVNFHWIICCLGISRQHTSWRQGSYYFIICKPLSKVIGYWEFFCRDIEVLKKVIDNHELLLLFASLTPNPKA